MLRAEDGQDCVEYALLVAAVAVVMAAAVGTVSQAVGGVFDSMTAQLTHVDASQVKR